MSASLLPVGDLVSALYAIVQIFYKFDIGDLQ
jgi:hypothetical protein